MDISSCIIGLSKGRELKDSTSMKKGVETGTALYKFVSLENDISLSEKK
jgi:hypothetical protein